MACVGVLPALQEFGVFGLGPGTVAFLFENAEKVVAVMRSDLGREINQGALANGFYIPATGVAGGMRNITCSKRPVASVADLKGLKMRTPPIDVTIRTFKALGATWALARIVSARLGRAPEAMDFPTLRQAAAPRRGPLGSALRCRAHRVRPGRG